MKYQTRLITRSIDQQFAQKKKSKADKKAAQKAKKSSRPEIHFTPGSTAAPKAQPASSSSPDSHDAVFALRDLRSQLQAAQAECVLPPPKRDPRVFTAILKNPAYQEFADVEFSYATSTGMSRSRIFDSDFKSTEPHKHAVLDAITQLLRVVSSRTSMSFESSLSSYL
jgi:hypothetical protein